MAYLNITDTQIELIHKGQIIKKFNIADNQGNSLACIGLEHDNHEETLTLSVQDNAARFVIKTSDAGYSYQYFLLDKPEGIHTFVYESPENPNDKRLETMHYSNGALTYQETRSYDADRGVWHVMQEKHLEQGQQLIYYFCEKSDRKSKIAYYVLNNLHMTEKGWLNADGQKDGAITVFDAQGRQAHLYYENGKKLSFGQRLFKSKMPQAPELSDLTTSDFTSSPRKIASKPIIPEQIIKNTQINSKI